MNRILKLDYDQLSLEDYSTCFWFSFLFLFSTPMQQDRDYVPNPNNELARYYAKPSVRTSNTYQSSISFAPKESPRTYKISGNVRETFDFAQSPSYYLKKQESAQDDVAGAPEEYQPITRESAQSAQSEQPEPAYRPSPSSACVHDNITSSIETRTDYDSNLMQRRPQQFYETEGPANLVRPRYSKTLQTVNIPERQREALKVSENAYQREQQPFYELSSQEMQQLARVQKKGFSGNRFNDSADLAQSIESTSGALLGESPAGKSQLSEQAARTGKSQVLNQQTVSPSVYRRQTTYYDYEKDLKDRYDAPANQELRDLRKRDIGK